jgi:hypothetical protein
MKKQIKQQMYSKMYLITPMVYEKIEKHLDNSDRISLNNINKPYFTPKIEFHGGQNNSPFQSLMPPPPPPSPPQQPPYGMPPNVPEGEQQQQHQLEQEQQSEMEFEQTDQKPIMKEEGTQTFVPVSEQSTQTDPIRRKVVPLETIGTQTDPIIEKKKKKKWPSKPKVSTQSIGVGPEPQPQPRIMMESIGVGPEPQPQPRIMMESIGVGPEPQIQQVQSVTQGIQTDDEPVDRPYYIPYQQVPALEYQPTAEIQPGPSRAIVPAHTRDITKIPKKTLSILKRTPIKITLPPGFRTGAEFHRLHHGQQIPIQRQIRPIMEQQQPRSITYESEQPRSITYQEFPISTSETRTVAIPEPTYFVETPQDEPPGQKTIKRSRESDEEIVPEHLIIRKQYKRKNKKPKQQQQTQPSTSQGLIVPQPAANIDLPPQVNRPKFECDTCGALLSSKHNLKRHKQREAVRLARMESESSIEDQPVFQRVEPLQQEQQEQQEQQQQPKDDEKFSSWQQFPSKRTASQAKLKPQPVLKRTVSVQNPQAEFPRWENPRSKPKGSSKVNLSKGKRATSPPPDM